MKVEQKFLITNSQSEVQNWLDRGWIITSVTAQRIIGDIYARGDFAIVLERESQPEE